MAMQILMAGEGSFFMMVLHTLDGRSMELLLDQELGFQAQDF